MSSRGRDGGVERCRSSELTGYAVELRCDADFRPPQGTAEESLEMAEKVKTLILSHVSDATEP